MARPRKPTETKRTAGTLRKGRENPNEPQIEIKVPSCPSNLSQRAKTVWKRVVPLLLDARIITLLHRDTVAEYCELISMSADLRAETKQNKQLIKQLDKEDEHFLSSLLSLKKESRAIRRERIHISDSIRKYATEFAMTAASQGKVNALPVKEKKVSGEKSKSRFFDRPLRSVK